MIREQSQQQTDRIFRDLRHALDHAESEVTSPMIPGELLRWCAVVRERLGGVEQAWHANRATHREVFEAIVEQDAALAHRVDQLEHDDELVRAELDALEQRLDALLAEVRDHDGGSEEPTNRGQTLRDDLLQWIERCRTHEQEIQTWFAEAYYRDGGAGD